MAEETEKNEDVEAEETVADGEGGSSTKKKKLLIGGGLTGILAAGALAAMMAVPSKEEKPRFQGPFTAPLFEEQFNCNLRDWNHFLRMSPEVMYQAYDPMYFASRTTDQLYLPQLKDAVLRVATTKSMEDLFGEADQDAFAEELAESIDPVLFPAHIGSSKLPWDPDEASGLRPGLSTDRTSFRGNFHDHVLKVDAEAHTLQIDEGPVIEFEDGDPDVAVIDASGSTLYVDTSSLKEEFVGEVCVGVQGRILRILPLDLLIQ